MSQAQILPADHFAPSVSIHNGRPATTSLEVAKFFGKRHDNVMRSISDLKANTPKEFTALNFEVSEYTDETGRVLPMFILHRDGFMLLVMGYTGKKAMQIKVAYILAFNKMEAQIAGNALPASQPTALTASTADDRKPLRSLVHAWAQIAGTSHTALWPQVKAHFQLARIDDLPVEWIGDALAFVQGKIDATGKALPEGKQELAEAPIPVQFREDWPKDMSNGRKDAMKKLERITWQLHAVLDVVRIFSHPGGYTSRRSAAEKEQYEILLNLYRSADANLAAAYNALEAGYRLGREVGRG